MRLAFTLEQQMTLRNPDLMGGTAKGSADTGVKTGETCLLFTCNSSVDLF